MPIPLHFAARQGDDFQDRFVDVEPDPCCGAAFLARARIRLMISAGSMAVCDDKRGRLPGLLQVRRLPASQRKQALALLTTAASG